MSNQIRAHVRWGEPGAQPTSSYSCFAAQTANDDGFAAERGKLDVGHVGAGDPFYVFVRSGPSAAERPPSRDEFERCARSDPFQLETLLRGNLEAPLLTFAAEAVALAARPEPTLIEALQQLLRHEKTYVREGACYGARPHLRFAALRSEIERVAREDTSATLREIAQEILDEDQER